MRTCAPTRPAPPSRFTRVPARAGTVLLILWSTGCTREDPLTAPGTTKSGTKVSLLAAETTYPHGCAYNAGDAMAGRTYARCSTPTGTVASPFSVQLSPSGVLYVNDGNPNITVFNTEPITISLSAPVNRVVAATTDAFLPCTGSYGSVTFSGPGGTVTSPLKSTAFYGECWPYANYTYYVTTDTISIPNGITQIRIQPFAPIDWLFYSPYLLRDTWAFGYAAYSIVVLDPAPAPPPRLTVACTFPAARTRGSTVDCTAKVVPDSFAFTITRRLAIRQSPIALDSATGTINYVPSPIESSSRIGIAARQSYHWLGPALTPTAVTIEATVVTSSGPVQVADSSTFAPTNRSWARMTWDEGRSKRHDDSLSMGADRMGRDTAARFLILPVNTGGRGTLLGIFLPDAPDSTKLPLKAVLAGPDSGLFYLSGAPSSGPWYRIFVIPAIVQPLTYKASMAVKDTISRWQKRQLGVDSTGNPFDTNNGSRRWCNSALIDSTARFAKRHEGWGKARNSHWGIGDSVFANPQTRLQDYLDGWVWPVDPTTGKVSGRVTWSWYGEIFYAQGSPYAVPQRAYDRQNGPEYTAVSSICSFLP